MNTIIMYMLRECRFVNDIFPAWSSGAGDLIEDWLEELKMELQGGPR